MLTGEQRRKVLSVLILSLMMIISAVTALNVALPSLAMETGASQRELQWIVDGYALVFAGLLLPAGAIGDRFGRRGTLLAGIGIFSAAALGAIFTSDPTVLIWLRVAMGAGAALIMPVTLSIITTSFPAEERGKAIGLWVGIVGAGAIIGLLASGLLLEWFSWNSIFGLNVGLGILAFLGALMFIPSSRDPDAAPLDIGGALFSFSGISAIVFGLIEAPEKGWGSGATLLAVGGGLALLAIFVIYELLRKQPMLDPRFFLRRPFSMGTLSLLAQFFGAFGFFFIIFQYLQVVGRYSPLQSGLALLPMALVLIPLSRHTPEIAKKFGTRLTSFIGLTCIGLGFIIWSFMGTDFSYWHFLGGLFSFGIGMAFAGPPATTAITSSLSAKKQGVASAVNDTARELGGALGIAALGSVLNSNYRTGIVDGFNPLGVPQFITEKAQESLIAVQIAAEKQGGPMAEKLLDIAKNAYVHGLTRALIIGAIVVLIVAVCIGLFGPSSSKMPMSHEQES